ncbi:MAG: sel1 repeat family protein [Halobacteria archaeon]|nr:sel1 repeat family protein [Halobacteria archaeon]
MNRLIVGLALYLLAASAMGDIWTSLFREKMQEAKNGISEAQFDVGTMYQNGRGVKADRNMAIEWFEKAAAQGDAKSISRLKLMEANATRFGKTSSEASKGDKDSLYDLGKMYMEGVGTNIDYGKAITAFEQSASQGHIKSSYKLGLIYYEGSGVKANSKLAFKWFRQAARADYPAAQFYLGKMYAEGTGVGKNRGEALIWLGKAVDGGFDQARGELINVSESLKADNVKTAAAANKESRARKSKAGRFSIEDVVLAGWNRDGNPVAWMPSEITTCRTEGNKVTCFSDDQIRNAGDNIIKFKTKAIISSFSGNGSFKVTYRNLVISTSQAAAVSTDGDDEEPGSLDEDTSATYKVKTGWSNPHMLKCKMKDKGSVSCRKNKAHAMVLTSPTTMVAGSDN